MDACSTGSRRTWARMILKTAGSFTFDVEGLEHIDPAQPAVYAANHLSALDIPVLYACLPTQFRILAKRELFSYPFLGWHLTRSGQIPIDQGDARASLRSLNRASESLRHGMPLAIFPEGGRSHDGRLQTLHGWRVLHGDQGTGAGRADRARRDLRACCR